MSRVRDMAADDDDDDDDDEEEEEVLWVEWGEGDLLEP